MHDAERDLLPWRQTVRETAHVDREVREILSRLIQRSSAAYLFISALFFAGIISVISSAAGRIRENGKTEIPHTYRTGWYCRKKWIPFPSKRDATEHSFSPCPSKQQQRKALEVPLFFDTIRAQCRLTGALFLLQSVPVCQVSMMPHSKYANLGFEGHSVHTFFFVSLVENYILCPRCGCTLSLLLCSHREACFETFRSSPFRLTT